MMKYDEDDLPQMTYPTSMSLENYMEDTPNGFSIRGREPKEGDDYVDMLDELPTCEVEHPVIDPVVEEILNTFGPDGDQFGPYDLELPFGIELYREARNEGMTEDEAWAVACMAQEIAENFWEAGAQKIAKRLRKYGDNDIRLTAEIVKKAFQGWVFRNRKTKKIEMAIPPYAIHKPEKTVLSYEPVTEDTGSINDQISRCRQDDDAQWMERLQQIAEEETQPEDLFNGKEKILHPDEMIYRRRKKEDREERTKKILSWVKQAKKETLATVFARLETDGQEGKFWRKLRESRKECLPPNRKNSKVTHKTPAEIWLTKAQVEQIVTEVNRRLKSEQNVQV
jgi:hypothetical protein